MPNYNKITPEIAGQLRAAVGVGRFFYGEDSELVMAFGPEGS